MTIESTRFQVGFEGGDPPVLVLTGELDPSGAPALDAAVDRVLSEGATGLVMDLGGLSFIDSAGLRSLLAAHERLAPGGLHLRRPSAFAARLLAITGLDQEFRLDSETDPG